jgi:hypothetical protein
LLLKSGRVIPTLRLINESISACDALFLMRFCRNPGF